MRRCLRVLAALVFVVVLDWDDWTPLYPLHSVAQVKAQQPIPPPNAWHPYRGGTNCVQVADANGNFSCSPLVTINPATGILSLTGGATASATFFGSIAVVPINTTFFAGGSDFVLARQTQTTVAPSGPQMNGVTFRVRPSPLIPGYCRVVAIAGNAFGAQYEYPMAFLNPSAAFALSGPPANGIFDYYVVDLPGGPGGC